MQTEFTVNQFPTLYGKDKHNKIKEWNIHVENHNTYSIIKYSYGYLNSKKVECTLQINKGKNLGKKNETTHHQQAIADAQSKWKRKKEIDKYSTVLSDIQNTDTGPVLPMLAQEYKKHVKKLSFPCYVQPKLDGYRMIFEPKTNTLTTRTGKPFGILTNTKLHQQLCELQLQFPVDGELYVHDSSFNFENYGILRRQDVSKLTQNELSILNKIEYHIYDIIISDVPFVKRLEELKKLNNNSNDLIKVVETIECNNENDITEKHVHFTSNNYEGSIVRNASGLYKQKFRSYDLLKYKDFDDSEFTIVGFTSETNVSGGTDKPVVWICKTESDKKFNVPSKGTREERTVLFENGDKFIGKRLWVQHFGWTNDGIPRFPKTMREGIASIREIE